MTSPIALQIETLPYEWKELLFDIAYKLPEPNREAFIVGSLKDLSVFTVEIAKENKWAITYGTIGVILGAITDIGLTLTVPLPGVLGGPIIFSPTAGMAKIVLGVLGFFYGFFLDHQDRMTRRLIKREIAKSTAYITHAIEQIICRNIQTSTITL